VQEIKNTAVVGNPITAVTEVFIHPKNVFDTLAVRENWSWVPFLLLALILFFPPYLYYSVVDFDWWRQMTADAVLGDVSPSEKQMFIDSANLSIVRLTQAISEALVVPIISFAILALYYNVMTRNDDKSVQGFSDWYGAMWWMALPSLLNALLAIILLTFQESNTQIYEHTLIPLSLAYVLNSTVESSWHAVFSSIRIDIFWTIYLGFVALRSWTNFSTQKAAITALLPYFTILLILVVTTAL